MLLTTRVQNIHFEISRKNHLYRMVNKIVSGLNGSVNTIQIMIQ